MYIWCMKHSNTNSIFLVIVCVLCGFLSAMVQGNKDAIQTLQEDTTTTTENRTTGCTYIYYADPVGFEHDPGCINPDCNN